MPLPHTLFLRLKLLAYAPLFQATLIAADSLESVEKAAVEWTRVRDETVQLETGWNSSRVLLESAVTVLGERVRRLEQERDLLVAETAQERQDVESLSARADAALADMTAMTEGVERLGARLIRFRPWLPPRLSTALDISYRSLNDAALTTSERMQVAVSMLNRIQQFDRSIVFSEEILPREGGPSGRLAEVVYWGLGQAYALDREAGKAWLGRPADVGWTWVSRDDVAGSVAALIEVCKDRRDPDFVELPAQVGEVKPGGSQP